MARVVIPGCPHHVTQRGNRGEDVFFSDADRLRYLALLGTYCRKYGLAIQAYCLMSTHVHLVAVPREEASLGAALKPLHMRYAQYVNWSRQVTGRLWQGRFFSCPLDQIPQFRGRQSKHVGNLCRSPGPRWVIRQNQLTVLDTARYR